VHSAYWIVSRNCGLARRTCARMIEELAVGLRSCCFRVLVGEPLVLATLMSVILWFGFW